MSKRLPPGRAYQHVIHLIERSGVAFRIHNHPAVTTIEEADRRVPHLTRNLLKTVVFRIKDADWILAAVNGHDRIHYKKLADAVTVKRTQLRSISPDEVARDLGFEIGGVGPFPVRENIRVVFDDAVRQLDTVFCGSGKNTRTIEMARADLVEITHGCLHPICK